MDGFLLSLRAFRARLIGTQQKHTGLFLLRKGDNK